MIIFTSMKRLTALIILALYSLSILGIGLKEFYCCGKLKSVTITFAHQANGKCDKEGKKGDCCKTEHQFLKVKDSHLVPGHIFCPVKFLADIDFPSFSNESISIYTTQTATSNSIHAPPFITRPIYILNCVYRI